MINAKTIQYQFGLIYGLKMECLSLELCANEFTIFDFLLNNAELMCMDA